MLRSTYLSIFNVSIALVLFFLLLFTPILIDTIHMADSMFLANLGWRGVNGLTPVIDYPHFYGGMVAQFVTYAFQIFGVSYKSIEYAFAMMFIVAAIVILAFSWRRLPLSSISMLIALAAALMLSRHPIEAGNGILIAHSFSYNHAGIVLMMAAMVFSLKPTAMRSLDIFVAIVMGVAMYGLILLKTTFGIFFLCVVICCTIQMRWLSALLIIAGAIFGMLILDPGMARALGSLEHLLETTAAQSAGGVTGRIRDGVLMVLTQVLAFSICMLLGWLLIKNEGLIALSFLFAAAILGLGYCAVMLTTGWKPDLKLLPFLTVFALLSVDRLTHSSTYSQKTPMTANHVIVLQALPIFIAYSLILPFMVVSIYSFYLGNKNANAALIEEGPAADYFVYGHVTKLTSVSTISNISERRAAAVSETARRIEAKNVNLDESDRYIFFADGINLLKDIPDVSSYGIVASGTSYDFTVPMRSRVVTSYPVWVTGGLRGIRDRSRLGADVDLVMMSVHVPGLELINDDLYLLMADDFRVCRRSTLWTLYARRGLSENLCANFP